MRTSHTQALTLQLRRPERLSDQILALLARAHSALQPVTADPCRLSCLKELVFNLRKKNGDPGMGWARGGGGVGPHPWQLLPVPPASLIATLTSFLLAQLLQSCLRSSAPSTQTPASPPPFKLALTPLMCSFQLRPTPSLVIRKNKCSEKLHPMSTCYCWSTPEKS